MQKPGAGAAGEFGRTLNTGNTGKSLAKKSSSNTCLCSARKPLEISEMLSCSVQA